MEITVSNINCMHCEGKIRKILDDNKIKNKVNLKNKTIKINDDDYQKVVSLLDSIGYKVS